MVYIQYTRPLASIIGDVSGPIFNPETNNIEQRIVQKNPFKTTTYELDIRPGGRTADSTFRASTVNRFGFGSEPVAIYPQNLLDRESWKAIRDVWEQSKKNSTPTSPVQSSIHKLTPYKPYNDKLL